MPPLLSSSTQETSSGKQQSHKDSEFYDGRSGNCRESTVQDLLGQVERANDLAGGLEHKLDHLLAELDSMLTTMESGDSRVLGLAKSSQANTTKSTNNDH